MLLKNKIHIMEILTNINVNDTIDNINTFNLLHAMNQDLLSIERVAYYMLDMI